MREEEHIAYPPGVFGKRRSAGAIIACLLQFGFSSQVFGVDEVEAKLDGWRKNPELHSFCMREFDRRRSSTAYSLPKVILGTGGEEIMGSSPSSLQQRTRGGRSHCEDEIAFWIFGQKSGVEK
jgi:hypothetical protein